MTESIGSVVLRVLGGLMPVDPTTDRVLEELRAQCLQVIDRQPDGGRLHMARQHMDAMLYWLRLNADFAGQGDVK